MLESLFNLFSDLAKSFITFLKILVRSKFFLPKHKTTSNNCIVLGNGPSLKNVLKIHSEALKKNTLFCVNKFPDTDQFELLKPRYFLITSKEYWEPGTIEKHQTIRENVKKALIEKTSWPLTFFCPAGAKSNPEFIKKIESNPNIEICFFNNTPVEGLTKLNHFFMNQNLGAPRPHNVLIPSILMAINGGIKNIYLIGADHSWLPQISVNDDNIAMFNNTHFYDETKPKTDSMHKQSQPRKLHEILDKFKLTFEGYFILKNYAISKNVNIYNCTPNSFIDAFDRKKLNEVLISENE